MQKPTALILAVLLIIGGGMFFILNKKPTEPGWVPDDPKKKTKITASSSSSPSVSSGGSVSGSTASGGTISVTPDASTNAASPNSTGGAGKSTTASGSASEQTTVDSGSSSGSSDSSSSDAEKQTEPVAAAPKDSSPPPPPQPVPSGKLILTESLQYLKNGQMLLGTPQSTLSYPVIKPGAPYSGTIGSPASLSQADVDRLKSYPSPEVVETPPPATKREYINGKWVEVPYGDPIRIPIGSYPNNTRLKQSVDTYISVSGPHIQRKLHTDKWIFTPAPSASYETSYAPFMGGYTKIRGVLKVQYDKADNLLGLEPSVWYQGDVEMGWGTPAFFSGEETRDELLSLVILGHWGKGS